MIGQLRGKLISKQAPQLIIDVGGVGYEVDAPMSTFYRLPALAQEVTLLTHMVVREDAQLLYGFSSEQERRLFRSLIKINGVGAKLAITILSGMEPEQFVRAIHDSDVASLVRLPGVGKKTAERLVVEMRDRLDDWQTDTELSDDSQAAIPMPVNAMSDAISALAALGYKPTEASKAVSKVREANLSTEEIIRKALQQMV